MTKKYEYIIIGHMARITTVERHMGDSGIEMRTTYRSRGKVGAYPQTKREYTSNYSTVADAVSDTRLNLGYAIGATLLGGFLTYVTFMHGQQDVAAHQNLLFVLQKDPTTGQFIDTPYSQIWNDGRISGLFDTVLPAVFTVGTLRSMSALPRAYGEFTAVGDYARRAKPKKK